MDNAGNSRCEPLPDEAKIAAKTVSGCGSPENDYIKGVLAEEYLIQIVG